MTPPCREACSRWSGDFFPRLRQPQHPISKRPKLPWPEPYSHQLAICVAESQDRLPRLAIRTDGDDAGDIDQAAVEPHALKDFRDTFATQLVIHGIVLKWVSLQLGHGTVGVTERHYARWMAQDGYRNPWQVPEGCLPTDLFAELDEWIPADATTTPLDATRSRKFLQQKR